MMKKYFAFILMAAVLTACTGIEPQEPVEDPTVPTVYSMTIKASKNVGTKALTLNGSTLKATWNAGEKVLVYQSGSQIGELTAAASANASTTLSGTFDNAPSTTADLTFYFHTAASPTYTDQDGTLEKIASTYDFCTPATVTAGNFTVNETTHKITVSNGISFGANQQAIVKFTLKNKATDAPISVTPLKISDGTNTYTVTPTSATSEIYIALPGFSNQTVCMVATAGGTSYDYIRSGVTFTNGQYYEITVKMNPVLAMANAAANSVGKVVATDGKLYTHVRTADLAGTTASGIVAYCGAAGSVESGNSSYKGMALALEDAVLRWGTWPNHTNYCSSDNHQCSDQAYCSTVSAALNAKNGIAATLSARDRNGSGHWHNAPCNGYNVARPSGASVWVIPSMGQWYLMAKGLTGKNSNLSDTDNPDYSFNNLNVIINAAGGNSLGWLFYWSSTEKDASNEWAFNIGGINSSRNGSRVSSFAKNTDNEYMHVRMVFAF